MAPGRSAQGGAGACFVGVLTFELCCLPSPRPECFDDLRTPERCCVEEQQQACFTPPFTRELCCGPPQNPGCWDAFFTPERCCPNVAASEPETVEEEGAVAAAGGPPGNEVCWAGIFSYEMCCEPAVQPFCFDPLHFTAERCCHPSAWRPSPLDRLRAELVTGADPYGLLELIPYPAAEVPSYSPLTPWLVQVIVGLLGPPGLWLEVGCSVGATAILTASTLRALGLSTGVVCIDPFTGGVDEWAEQGLRPQLGGGLRMDVFGHVRLYETFLANVFAAGLRDFVLPLRISSVSGLRTLHMLYRENRFVQMISVVFLGGAAHEEAEMLLEARLSWQLLAAPGVLMGERWPQRPGVWEDVLALVRELRLPKLPLQVLMRLEAPSHRVSQPEPGLALLSPTPEGSGIWLVPKGEWG